MQLRHVLSTLVISGTAALAGASGALVAGAAVAGPASAAQAQYAARVDFNGDGAGDYVIAAPGETVNGRADAGSVYVHYGTPARGSAPATQRLNQDSPGVSGVAEPGDEFGAAIETGNFDGDQYTDLAVGAPGEGFGSSTADGVVAIFYGGPNGWSRSAGVSASNVAGQAFHTDDGFGATLAVGNFNGTGTDDLAVGLPGWTSSYGGGAGAVDVFYSGSTGAGITTTGAQHFHSGAGGIGGAPEAGDTFGGALAAGQVNRSGGDDLLIGVPGEDLTSGPDDSGLVLAIFAGNPGPLNPSTTSAIAGTTFPGVDDNNDNVTVRGFGSAMVVASTGTVTVGAPDSSIDAGDGVEDSAGVVVTVPTASTGFVSASAAIYDQNSPGAPGHAEAGDLFGLSLAAGDWTGDGIDDIAIGVPGETIGTAVGAGGVNIRNSTGAGQFISQNTPGVPGGSETNDIFGWSVSAGDYNGDGVPDLAVGSPGEAIGSTRSSGMVIVIRASSNRITPTASEAIGSGSLGFANTVDAFFGNAIVLGHGGTAVVTAARSGTSSQSAAASAAVPGAVSARYRG